MCKPSIPDMKYHANDWNIVTKQEKEKERINGLEYLSSNEFPGRCVEWFLITYHALEVNKEHYDKVINNRWFFVIITGKNITRKIILVTSCDDVVKYIKSVNIMYEPKQIVLTFINMIQKCIGCCSGVVLSDGKGRLKIELMNDTVSTRDLTDGSKKTDSMIYLETKLFSLKIISGKNNPYIKSNFFDLVVLEIVKSCYRHAGYYELIFGTDQFFSFPNVFFTYYSDNKRYGFDITKWDH